MRGTRVVGAGKCPRNRFIPAHAGNAAVRFMGTTGRPVHPRACGERDGLLAKRLRGSGSSPRMRGTRWTSGEAITWLRFIPAHAGNAMDFWRSDYVGPVHPRACGERSSTQVIEVSLVLPCQTTLPLFLLYGISPGLPKIFTPCSLLSSPSGVA